MSKREEIDKELKALTRQQADTQQIMNDLQRQQSVLSKKIKALQNQKRQLTPTKLLISDHAVLRYAERKYKIDVEAMRAEIQTAIGEVGDVASLKFRGFVVSGNTVVTFLPNSAECAS